jgi:hypothetical protein
MTRKEHTVSVQIMNIVAMMTTLYCMIKGLEPVYRIHI